MYKVSIPDISKEELLSRYKRIKPIVEFEGKKYFLREFTEQELTGVSYMLNINKDKRGPVNVEEYIPCYGSDFECLHTYGYYGLFKPTIAEVLAQIPEKELIFVDAFEIIYWPETMEEFAKNMVAFENGYHVSRVRLYTSRKNPNVQF